MSDWLGLGFIVLLLIIGVAVLSRLGKPYVITVEEFEKRASENKTMLAAGLLGLQKVLDPGTAKAIEVQEDFKAGHLDGEQESGEGDDDESVTSDKKSLES